MKRSTVRWLSAGLAGLSLLGAGMWATGWWPNLDPSVELAERFGSVENGSAYDRAAVDLRVAKRVVLPDDAMVRRSAEPGRAELYMRKTLAFHGHPPEGMSVRGARKNMGCAVKTEDGALVVATFGEWDSRIEGGAYMRVVAVVPEGVEVEQRAGLSGPDSAGREWHGRWLTKPKDARGGYWYGPASPADGWTAVPDVADPERTARGLGAPHRPVRRP